MTALAAHSPLGASGAYRWMVCPASVQLSQGCEDEESDFALEGTAAHMLGEYCLTTGREPWQFVGLEFANLAAGGGDAITVTVEMSNAVAAYLGKIKKWHPERNQGNSYVERRFHCPDIHDLFYGQSDFTCIDSGEKTLHVWDYKHGAGIVVEATDSPQLKYYACGMLEDLALWNDIERVVLHVVQPRAWHMDGPHRTWSCSTDELDEWLADVLVPAMNRALVSRDIKSGEHCRFCPVRSYACPQLVADMEELAAMVERVNKSEKGVDELTNAEVARFLELFDVAKIVKTNAERTAFKRLSNGADIPGFKLAPKRANREWKDGADKALKKKFGDQAFTEPALKSPAQIDALPGGEAMSARWAFKPDTGLTVVPAKDARPAVNKDVKTLFTAKK